MYIPDICKTKKVTRLQQKCTGQKLSVQINYVKWISMKNSILADQGGRSHSWRYANDVTHAEFCTSSNARASIKTSIRVVWL